LIAQLALSRDFYCNYALKLSIAGLPDVAKTTRANFMHQLEAAENFDARTISASAGRF